MSVASHVLSAFVLNGDGGGRAINAQGTQGWTPDQGVLWAVVDRNHDLTESWLRDTMSLPASTCQSLLAEDTRPRCVNTADGLIVILRGVNLNPGAEPDDMVTVRMWIDAQKVVCIRGRRMFALEDVGTRLKAGTGARAPGGVLVQLIDKLTERMLDVVSNLEDLVDAIEDAVAEVPGSELRPRLAVPRRQVATMRRYLSPQRDMTARLTTEPTDLLDAGDRVRLREVTDELTRLVEELDLLRERSMMIQEQIVARASEQMNRTMYILSLVAAIFLPLGLITGLLGINVGGVPGTDSPLAFWVVCGMLVALAVVQWFLFRRHRLL